MNNAAAGNNITLQAAQNTATQSSFYQKTESGLLSGGSGLSISIGNRLQSTDQKDQSTTTAASTVGAIKGNVSITAGSAGLTGYNTYNSLIDKQTGNFSPEKAKDISINLSLGSSKSQSNTASQADTARASTLTAGNNIALSATGAGIDFNITAQGANITAGNTARLTADNQVNLVVATNQASQSSTKSSGSSSIGVSYSPLSGWGFNVAASKGQGKSDGQDTSFTNTQIAAGNIATIKSGADTNLKGAVVTANTIKADVGQQFGGSLSIESLQDTSSYTSKQTTSGGSISVGDGKATGGSISASKSNINSTFQSVNQQSGLKAGDGGFQVTVAGNTDLKGGAITSTQKASDDKANTFSTGGQLTTTDLQNTASYKGTGVGISIDVGKQDGKFGVAGVGVGVGTDKGQASSTTTAGISGLAGNTAVRTGDAPAGLQKIFDASTVQKKIDAEVQITQTFSKQASQAVASYAQTKYDELKTTNPEEAKKWAEGGVYRVAMHTVTGALSGGINGAVGAALSASSAPLMNDFQDGIAGALDKAGLGKDAAKLISSSVAGLTAAGVGAVVGGGQGAATALTVDANNRQLHPTEVQRVKELANGDPQKQARLTAAACALVRCADGVPKDDSSYAYLKAVQDAGEKLPDEQRTLLAQQSRSGDPTRTFGPLFRYTVIDEYIIDPTAQNKLGTRLAGALQTGAGLAGVAGSGALCTTGVGCFAGLVTGTVSADYTQAGAKQALTGNAAVPYGEQVLQSLGISPQAAAITYGVLGVAPAAVEGVLLNKAVNIEAAFNGAAKLSYEPIGKFGAQGVQVTPAVMQTAQAQAIFREYQAAGLGESFARDLTADLILTGKALPVPSTVGQGVELIKVVPRTATGGDVVSAYTPFFVTRQEFDNLSRLSVDQIAQRLGLPAEQGVRGAQLGFDVYAIVPKAGAIPKVFVSEVAPIRQGSYGATGGAQQVLVPNRTVWTSPVKIGTIAGAKQ